MSAMEHIHDHKGRDVEHASCLCLNLQVCLAGSPVAHTTIEAQAGLKDNLQANMYPVHSSDIIVRLPSLLFRYHTKSSTRGSTYTVQGCNLCKIPVYAVEQPSTSDSRSQAPSVDFSGQPIQPHDGGQVGILSSALNQELVSWATKSPWYTTVHQVCLPPTSLLTGAADGLPLSDPPFNSSITPARPPPLNAPWKDCDHALTSGPSTRRRPSFNVGSHATPVRHESPARPGASSRSQSRGRSVNPNQQPPPCIQEHLTSLQARFQSQIDELVARYGAEWASAAQRVRQESLRLSHTTSRNPEHLYSQAPYVPSAFPKMFWSYDATETATPGRAFGHHARNPSHNRSVARGRDPTPAASRPVGHPSNTPPLFSRPSSRPPNSTGRSRMSELMAASRFASSPGFVPFGSNLKFKPPSHLSRVDPIQVDPIAEEPRFHPGRPLAYSPGIYGQHDDLSEDDSGDDDSSDDPESSVSFTADHPTKSAGPIKSPTEALLEDDILFSPLPHIAHIHSPSISPRHDRHWNSPHGSLEPRGRTGYPGPPPTSTKRRKDRNVARSQCASSTKTATAAVSSARADKSDVPAAVHPTFQPTVPAMAIPQLPHDSRIGFRDNNPARPRLNGVLDLQPKTSLPVGEDRMVPPLAVNAHLRWPKVFDPTHPRKLTPIDSPSTQPAPQPPVAPTVRQGQTADPFTIGILPSDLGHSMGSVRPLPSGTTSSRTRVHKGFNLQGTKP